jgi:transposase-like protein
MRKSRISKLKQMKLVEHFVAGTTTVDSPLKIQPLDKYHATMTKEEVAEALVSPRISYRHYRGRA